MADVLIGQEWTAALATLSAQLDDLERRLDADAWDEPANLAVIDLAGPVPPPLVPAARRLAERLAALEQRMAAELAAARDALADVALRRQAARGYHRSS